MTIAAPFDGTRWNNPQKTYPAGWTHHTFPCAAMGGQQIGYTLHLPPAIADQSRRFPVVYMLHGRGGNENMWTKSGLAPANVILACPNGGKNGKYLNAFPGTPMDGSYESESILLEFVAHIDATYRTKADRGHRALQGFSMGGFGTFRHGLKHLDLWSSIYTFAAAINTKPEDLAKTEPALLASMLGGDPERWRPEMAQSVAVAKRDAIIASGIKIKGAVGGSDGLKAVNLKMYDQLKALGIPNEGCAVVPKFAHNIGYVPALKPIEWAEQFFAP